MTKQLTPTQLYRLYVVTAACGQCKAPRGEYCKGQLGKPMKSGGHISRVGVARAIFKSRPELRASDAFQSNANARPGWLPDLAARRLGR